jgi:armadillo repeat-containing protein 8
MPATASGGARPEEEEEEVSPAPSPSTSASACMGTRAEELTARLAATGPGPGAGRGAAAAGGEEVEHERVRALREIKNQIIGNRTKKLLYLRLGAVPSVVAALAEPGASPAALVQAAAAAGSFACGVDDGARAVLAAGAVGHLTRLLAHPDEKVGSSPPSLPRCLCLRESDWFLGNRKVSFLLNCGKKISVAQLPAELTEASDKNCLACFLL